MDFQLAFYKMEVLNDPISRLRAQKKPSDDGFLKIILLERIKLHHLRLVPQQQVPQQQVLLQLQEFPLQQQRASLQQQH
jgi:hypothetical protein